LNFLLEWILHQFRPILEAFMEKFRIVFSQLPDPRDCTAQHDLTEIMFIALAASICGAQTCAAMAEFGRSKEPLLRQFLELKHGIPSHDTFSRVFRHLDPQAFAEAFQRFMAAFGAAVRLEAPSGVVAIDGKSLRRAYERGRACAPRMMVSAWGARTRMVLGQTEAPNGNEVAGALNLLKMLTLKGCVITADALHCHRGMAEAIRAAKADYVLKIKSNQPGLLADAKAALAAAGPRATRAETVTQAHDRIERRMAVTVPVPGMARKHAFPGLAAVARIEASRTVGDKTTTHDSYVLLSKRFSAAQVLDIVREHWSIENSLHWSLDVVFQEDLSRTRKDNAPANLATMRHLALNILRSHPRKTSMNLKRQHAGWNDAFLIELFTHMR
jgi:predicted transposase YbfD/YdcC